MSWVSGMNEMLVSVEKTDELIRALIAVSGWDVVVAIAATVSAIAVAAAAIFAARSSAAAQRSVEISEETQKDNLLPIVKISGVKNVQRNKTVEFKNIGRGVAREINGYYKETKIIDNYSLEPDTKTRHTERWGPNEKKIYFRVAYEDLYGRKFETVHLASGNGGSVEIDGGKWWFLRESEFVGPCPCGSGKKYKKCHG